MKALWQQIAARGELIVVIAVYLLAVTLVLLFRFPDLPWSFLSSRRAKVNYVTAKQLEPNYRISKEDLARPFSGPGAWGWFLPDRDMLVGKYVVHRIDPNTQVDASNLQEEPSLQVDDGFDLVVFPLDSKTQLCSLLNAGSYVDAMGSQAPAALKVRVHAVERPQSDSADKISASCFALLEVERAKEPLFAPDKLQGLHLVLATK